VAVAAEPDLLFATGMMLSEMGAELAVAVTTTRSPLLETLPVAEVLISDLDDFERCAKAADCDLLMTHSHGRQAAQRLGKPLFRIGIPMFDRVGNSHICHVGYRGTRNFVYAVGNLLIDQQHHSSPDDWPLPAPSREAATAYVPATIPRPGKPQPDHLAPAGV
jgi:nitrogenase molybdenum-iron protein NifN